MFFLGGGGGQVPVYLSVMSETKTGDEIVDEIRAYSIKDGDIAHEKPWFMAVFILIGGVFLGGGFKYFLFSSLFGEDFQFD